MDQQKDKSLRKHIDNIRCSVDQIHDYIWIPDTAKDWVLRRHLTDILVSAAATEETMDELFPHTLSVRERFEALLAGKKIRATDWKEKAFIHLTTDCAEECLYSNYGQPTYNTEIDNPAVPFVIYHE